MVQNVLPVFRSLIAKELVERHGLSQIEAAKKLGVTQAAVSQYLCLKRGKRTSKPSAVTHKVQKMAVKLAMEISENGISPNEVTKIVCELCAEINAR